jgi:CBS domain containing-hemolysin-like protein
MSNSTTTGPPFLDFAQVVCHVVDTKSLLCFNNVTFVEVDEDVLGSTKFYMDLGISVGLLVVAGILSGLSMGLFTLDPMNIEILRRSGPPAVRKQAAAVAPLVKRHHLVLVTMLLIQAAATEALPLFLDRLVGPIVAVALSVSGVVVFGEILPNAVFSKHGLAISARLTWLVWLLIALLFPVAWPVSKLLDCLLGHEQTFYRRAEIKTLIGMHAEAAGVERGEKRTNSDAGGGGGGGGGGGSQHEHMLSQDEANLIRGAIDLSSKTVADLSTPLDDVFMLDIDTKLTRPVLEELVRRSFSRIPVTRGDRKHVVGVLLMKQLVLVRPDEGVPVSSLPLRAIPRCPSSLDCYGALEMFQISRSHIALVTDSDDAPIGCVTLEDILEELLDEELSNESDALVLSASVDGSGSMPQSFGASRNVSIDRRPAHNRLASIDTRTFGLAVGVAAARRLSTMAGSPTRLVLTESGNVDSVDMTRGSHILDRHYNKGRRGLFQSTETHILDPHHAKGRHVATRGHQRRLRQTVDGVSSQASSVGETQPLLSVNGDV